jgi:hypothetical protein
MAAEIEVTGKICFSSLLNAASQLPRLSIGRR